MIRNASCKYINTDEYYPIPKKNDNSQLDSQLNGQWTSQLTAARDLLFGSVPQT